MPRRRGQQARPAHPAILERPGDLRPRLMRQACRPSPSHLSHAASPPSESSLSRAQSPPSDAQAHRRAPTQPCPRPCPSFAPPRGWRSGPRPRGGSYRRCASIGDGRVARRPRPAPHHRAARPRAPPAYGRGARSSWHGRPRCKARRSPRSDAGALRFPLRVPPHMRPGGGRSPRRWVTCLGPCPHRHTCQRDRGRAPGSSPPGARARCAGSGR